MELLERLYDKDDKKAYQALIDMEGRSAESNQFYSLFDEFVKMLDDEKSYVRIRGFRMICAQAKWDCDNKIETGIEKILSELDDEKPIAVRQCLSALHILILFKPELSEKIAAKLKSIDCMKYKDTMRQLIQKDIAGLLLKME